MRTKGTDGSSRFAHGRIHVDGLPTNLFKNLLSCPQAGQIRAVDTAEMLALGSFPGKKHRVAQPFYQMVTHRWR